MSNAAKAVVKVYDNAAKTIADIQAEIKKLSDKVGNGDGRYVRSIPERKHRTKISMIYQLMAAS